MAFDQTIGHVARDAELSAVTIRLYSKLGLLDSRKASNGITLYRSDAAEKARRIHAERLANRGRRRA
ncbi:MAG: MerR family transcriptional regulator [Gammaproteobacteria bacterium]|nr:MerR family transcriptional regulator [Gammaproteobacteria bacterium]